MVRRNFLLPFLILCLAGCASFSYERASYGDLPPNMPERAIEESPIFPELVRNYGQGITYERTKIKFLLNETRNSPFRFDRNGYQYDSETTANHLSKKYRQRFKDVTTARIFIDHVASISSKSGRYYFALPEDGIAYPTGGILDHHLERLENYMDKHYGPAGN